MSLTISFLWLVETMSNVTEFFSAYTVFTINTLFSRSSEISFEIQIRKRRPINILKEVLLENEDGRAYYHTWEERIASNIVVK